MENSFLDHHPILKTPEKLNPYRQAMYLLTNRIRWDIKPIAWSSRNKIKKLKNTHKGEKAVILCNGPSLNKVDFDRLEGVFTIGLNKINLLFDRTDFRPSMIAAVNELVIEQNAAFYNETQIPLFLDTEAKRFVNYRDNVHFLHSSNTAMFSRDISGSVWKGGTVTFVAMQLAFHLGFDKVALIGCDHYFNSVGAANQLAISTGKDDSHFDPNYFAGGMKWHLPNIAASEYAYSLAHEMYNGSNKMLINATDGGYLDILPRVSLDNFLDKKF